MLRQGFSGIKDSMTYLLTIGEYFADNTLDSLQRKLGKHSKKQKKTAKMKKEAIPDASVCVEEKLVERLADLNGRIFEAIEALDKAEKKATGIEKSNDRAAEYQKKVLPCMQALRDLVDEAETITAADLWPVPTYGEMLFWI